MKKLSLVVWALAGVVAISLMMALVQATNEKKQSAGAGSTPVALPATLDN